MFIANLTYKKPFSEVEKYLEEHIAYLEGYYKLGKFICSGRKVPLVGGIIISNAKDLNEMNEIISEDPFHINDIASYEIIEFYPTNYADNFKSIIEV